MKWKNVSEFITWLRPSVEGKDGRSSARALTNVWYVILNTMLSIGVLMLVKHIVTVDKVNERAVEALWVLIWLIIILNAVILIIFGLVTAQNVNEGIRAFKGTPEPVKITTETTTEVT